MISCNVFTGRMAALSTRMTGRESCISGRWALKPARSYVVGASLRIIIYKEFNGTIVCDGWKCKQCDSCRPLHDVGSMIAHMDRWEAKRGSDRRQ